MTAYEWEEEVPQPKPPTRRCTLVVEVEGQGRDLRAGIGILLGAAK